MSARPGLRWIAAVGLGLALAAAPLAGCSSKKKKVDEEIKAVTVHVVPTADANPDDGGRPSPVVLRIYQLRENSPFAQADFFALYNDEQATLAASLVAKEERVLLPGQEQKFEMPVSGETRYFGAIAAYRDVRNARWRAIVERPDKMKKELSIAVTKDQVVLMLP